MTTPTPALVDRRTPIVEAVEKALPSVVNIGTERMVRTVYTDPRLRYRGDLFDQFFQEFFGAPAVPGYRTAHSLGSGVIVDPAGYILTNYHVIERASRIRVMLSDETTYDAVFLAGDEINDLALIKIDPAVPVAALPFAEDDDLMLGETIIALGNPFGLAHTVTVGVLSATNREARYGGEVLYRDILQTDAAVNPGNSGGPLLNINGEMIGINVAIYQQAQNIGFAVPVKRARELLARWMSPRILKKTWLGFEPESVRDVIQVQYVDPTSPAASAGVHEGAIIRAVNNRPVKHLYEMNRELIKLNVNDPVTLTLEGDAGTQTVTLALQPLPKPSGSVLANRLLGLEFDEPEATPERLQRAFRTGLQIRSVVEGSVAARAGIRPGLLLTRINDVEIKTLDDVGIALENIWRGDSVLLTLVSVIERDTFIIAQTSSLQLTAQ